jgi:hypothetical protein
MLNQGFMIAGTASTDTHRLALQHAGVPRSYVASDVTDMRLLDQAAFDQSVKEMRAFGTSGPFVDFTISDGSGGDSAGLGEVLTGVSGAISLAIKIQAPCWIPVEEIRIFANGQLIERVAIPSTCTGVVRYDDSLEKTPVIDTHYVLEAGQVLPEDPNAPLPLPGSVMSVILPRVISLAFTNPVFVDVDGNGLFDRPGVAPPEWSTPSPRPEHRRRR